MWVSLSEEQYRRGLLFLYGYEGKKVVQNSVCMRYFRALNDTETVLRIPVCKAP